MSGFLGALQFLTILRLGKEELDPKTLSSSTIYFPLLGALLGLVLIGLNQFLSIILPEGMVNLLLVTILIILTGALHLDGLADTFDALASGKDREEMLSIMRNSHQGSFGVLALVIVILFKLGLLSAISGSFKNLGIFLMTVISRYSLTLSLFSFPYARREGKAKVFFEVTNLKRFIFSTLIILILVGLTLKWVSLAILFSGILFTLIMNTKIKRVLGGLTGDTLGALCELNEVFILFLIFVISKFYI